jgi:hypothetical protein
MSADTKIRADIFDIEREVISDLQRATNNERNVIAAGRGSRLIQ